jgi:hypothetical protein
MNRLKVNLFVCVVAAVLLALLLAPAVAQAQAAWSVVPSPSPGVSGNELNSVAVVAATDIWAVGDVTAANGASQTLTEHWNGTQWSVVQSPNPSAFHNVLHGVTAISTTDVWAVGWFNNTQDIPMTLIEHWNGTQWSVVASPNGSINSNFLFGVTAVSSNDVWAVGEFNNASGFFQTLTEHWNGRTWRVVSSPNVGTHNNVLNGVTAISANDVWAVGDFLDSTSNAHTLIEHWNGKKWSVVPSPNPGTGANTLNAVQAVSTDNVWAVGQTSTQTLIEHWNGKKWSVVASPNVSMQNNLLSGVAIVSANNIWAVGFVVSNGLTLIEHWNGTQWSIVSSPNPSSSLNILDGAAADSSSGQTWAVGVFFNASGLSQTLTEFNP